MAIMRKQEDFELLGKTNSSLGALKDLDGAFTEMLCAGGQASQAAMIKQPSLSGLQQSSLRIWQEGHGGDTGASRSNDLGGLFMNRGFNTSFESRPNSIISPYLTRSNINIL